MPTPDVIDAAVDDLIAKSTLELFDLRTIYAEHGVEKSVVGKEVLERAPEAEIVSVKSHWNIKQLRDPELAAQWNKIKRQVLVLGVKKGLTFRPNGRSTDFVAPSHANGCTMACTYCYVARRKGYANPVTVFTNIFPILDSIQHHASELGVKKTSNQCDPQYWTYDIGENNDVSVDAWLNNNPKRLIELFTKLPNAKGSFATKYVNYDMLNYDPQLKTRVRFSLMPAHLAKVVDVRTSPVLERIKAVDAFQQAGYEVHFNFSPVIVYDGWTADWVELFDQLNSMTSDTVKAQAKCEVIFLTHNSQLHNINLKWHPKGESWLWTPQWQEPKVSQTGGQNLRYKWKMKKKLVDHFVGLVKKHIPWCEIRYIF